MVRIKARITGDKELKRKFEDKSRIKDPMGKYLDFISRDIKDTAARYSPVEHGILQGAWESSVQTNKNPMTATVSNATAYALPLEFSGYKPRASGKIPFLQPAVDTVMSKITRRSKLLGKDIEKEYKRK